MVRKLLSVLLVALSIVTLSAIFPVLAAQAQQNGLLLHRRLEHESVLPGEEVGVTLEVVHAGEGELSYTLIEEIPPEIQPVDTGLGAFNRLAGFIVWSGALQSGERNVLKYTLRLTEEAPTRVPLYAYLSASNGMSAEHAAELLRVEMPVQIGFESTLIMPGESTAFRLRVENPLDRPVQIALKFDGPESLGLNYAPHELLLASGEILEERYATSEMEAGTYPVRLQLMMGAHPVGPERRATLTVSAVRDERLETPVFDPWHDRRTPGFAERIHAVTLPARLLAPGEQLLLFVRPPAGAHYVTGTGRVTASESEPVEPYMSEGHLIFPVPSGTDFTVRYVLAYEDADSIVEGEWEEQKIGLLSLGREPRVLRGTSELLQILDAAEIWDLPTGEGVEIVTPGDGRIFSDRQHVDVEVEAPEGARISLYLNDQPVSTDRLGQQGSDPAAGRYGEKYIAIPLPAGENRITAEALLPDGSTLSDSIVVYRSGSPTQISIHPITQLTADSVDPYTFEIEVTDDHGLPPADGTVITLDVQGGKVLSEDSHPDWQGHQQLLYRGKSYLVVEPPNEPRTLRITARLGEVAAEESFAVTTQVDRWFVVGHGSLRAEHAVQPPAEGVAVNGAVRLFARGPVDHDAVLTVAYDPAGLALPSDPSTLWLGDASTEGRFGNAGTERLYVRAERELSYIQLGVDEVDFVGNFSGYLRSHYGLHYYWTDLPQMTLRAFRVYEASKNVEEELAGDGTRYYRLKYGYIEPYSEDVTLIRRERLHPHRIVSERRLERDAYRVDYRTGQIFLLQPLAIVDEDGYLLSMRVRYQTVGEEESHLVQGVQSHLTHPLARLRGTFWQVDGPPQSKKNVLSVGLETELHDTEIELEIARSVTAASVGRAYRFQINRRNLADWNLRLSHQNVEPAFEAVDRRIEGGMVTVLRGERPFGGSRKLAVNISREQKTPVADAIYTAELGADFASRSLRPGLLLRGTWGRSMHGGMSLEGTVASEFRAGRVELKSEHALVGPSFTKQSLAAEYELFPTLSTTLDLSRERSGEGSPVRYRMTTGLTQSLKVGGADLLLKGGYELAPSSAGATGTLVYGASTRWQVTDAHAIEAGLEQRRSAGTLGSDSLGTNLGWIYRAGLGESRLTLDRQTSDARLKHALQWQGNIFLSEKAGLRGDVLWTDDTPGGARTRISIGAAYRTPSLVLLGSMAGERRLSDDDQKGSLEARVQGMYRASEQLALNLGYARRMTAEPTRTAKYSLGASLQIAPRWSLLAEHSILVQHDTKTTLTGAMVGLSREVLDDLWLTVGYSFADYVGFDGYGENFARQRSGLFLELDLAFSELSLGEWIILPRKE